MQQPFDRFSFVAYSEKRQTEWIFAYENRIPTSSEEPDLFGKARIMNQEPGQIELALSDKEIVILLTTETDNKFRRENPDLVAKNETLLIER